MVVKTITITEEAYNALRRMKYGDASFSEVILETARGRKNSLDQFFGILKDSKKELEEMRKKVAEGRKQADRDAREKMRKLRGMRGRLYDHS